MSTPITATELPKLLNRWKIPFKPYKDDWASHNRGQRGKGWGNVFGMVIHHTGTDGDAREDLYKGDSELPGPKVQFYIDKNGLLWLIGWGRANHAGGGDPAVLNHVKNEDYTGILKPHYHEGQDGAEDGNAFFYGVEVGYSGKHEMSDKQYATLMRLCAAIAEHHKWTDKSFFAHGEWSDWKWDPGVSNGTMANMVGMRADLRSYIRNGPEGHPDMPADDGIDQADKTNTTYEQVWHTDRMTPPIGHATTENPTWHPDSVIRHAAEQAEAANVTSTEILKEILVIKSHLGL